MGIEDKPLSRWQNEDVEAIERGRNEELGDIADKIGATPTQLKTLKFTETDISNREKREVVEGVIGNDNIRIERELHWVDENEPPTEGNPWGTSGWDIADRLFINGEKVDLNLNSKYDHGSVDWIMENVYKRGVINDQAKDRTIGVLDRKD